MARAGLNPDIVTEAAARIIDADGLAALTLARVAADLGIAPPSLYKHVAGLDDLILRVTTLSVRRLTDNLTAAVIGRSGRDALLAVAAAYRSYGIEHASLYALTQSRVDLSSSVLQAEATRAVEILAAAIRSYNVPDDRLVHAIRVVRAGLHGFVDIEARGGFQMSNSVDESFQVLIDTLDASLGSLGKKRTGSGKE